MPLNTVTEREFLDLIERKQMALDSRIPVGTAVLNVLFSGGFSGKMPIGQFFVLGFILTRTLTIGRLASQIAMGEFTEALPMSLNTVRRHLQALSDNGFLHVYRTVAGANNHEKEARMFEIACKKLVNLDTKNLEKQAGIAPKGGSNFGSPPSHLGGTPLHNKDHEVAKATNTLSDTPKGVVPARPSRNSTAGKTSPNSVAGDNVIPIPKKPRATAVRSDSIQAVLATVKTKSAATQTARVSAAAARPAHLISKVELQALIDKFQKSHAPWATTRVIVTLKELGVLKKRMKEAPPPDLAEFLKWLFMYWVDLSSKNRATHKKRARAGMEHQGNPLPVAPDFATIAYWYPYFLKAHANFVTETPTRVDETKEADRKVAQMAKQLAQSERDKEMLRQKLHKSQSTLVRRTRPTVEASPPSDSRNQPPARELQSLANLDLNDSSLDDLPDWETRVEPKVAKYAKR